MYRACKEKGNCGQFQQSTQNGLFNIYILHVRQTELDWSSPKAHHIDLSKECTEVLTVGLLMDQLGEKAVAFVVKPSDIQNEKTGG